MALAPKTETLPFSSARSLAKVKELTFSQTRTWTLVRFMKEGEENLEKEVKYEVDRKVTLKLIKRVLSRIQGVYSVKKDLWRKGIRMRELEGGLGVSLALVVEEGVLIPQMAEEVQKKVSEEVERSLGISIARVDIKIEGIKFLE